MNTPDWVSASAGTRVRVALWLHAEVGVGETFTKARLRLAFPNVEQIDRRMRELRPDGWVITTYREDRSLGVDELRLVREGGAVWEPGYPSLRTRSITDRERKGVFAADGYACVVCGLMGGETYPDEPFRTVKLLIQRRPASEFSERGHLRTVCERCNVGDDSSDANRVNLVLSSYDAMTEVERVRFLSWVREGRRQLSPDQILWSIYSRLSASEREDVRVELCGEPISQSEATRDH